MVKLGFQGTTIYRAPMYLHSGFLHASVRFNLIQVNLSFALRFTLKMQMGEQT